MELTHFISMVSFNTFWKYRQITAFLIFLGSIERDQRHKEGLSECEQLICRYTICYWFLTKSNSKKKELTADVHVPTRFTFWYVKTYSEHKKLNCRHSSDTHMHYRCKWSYRMFPSMSSPLHIVQLLFCCSCNLLKQ